MVNSLRMGAKIIFHKRRLQDEKGFSPPLWLENSSFLSGRGRAQVFTRSMTQPQGPMTNKGDMWARQWCCTSDIWCHLWETPVIVSSPCHH